MKVHIHRLARAPASRRNRKTGGGEQVENARLRALIEDAADFPVDPKINPAAACRDRFNALNFPDKPGEASPGNQLFFRRGWREAKLRRPG